RGIVVWCKPNGRRTQGRWGNTCEYLVWGTNGPRPLDALPGALAGHYVYSTPAAKDRHHPTEKPHRETPRPDAPTRADRAARGHAAWPPRDLMRHIVQILAPGGPILAPFAGSGTTGVAALAEGRGFIGIELSDPYRRIAEEVAALGQGGDPGGA